MENISNVRGPLIIALGDRKYREMNERLDPETEELRDCIYDWIVRTGRPPEPAEIAETMGWSIQRVYSKLHFMKDDRFLTYKGGKIKRKKYSFETRLLMKYPRLARAVYYYDYLYRNGLGGKLRCYLTARDNKMERAGIRKSYGQIFDLFRKPEEGDIALLYMDGEYLTRTVHYDSLMNPYLISETDDPEIIYLNNEKDIRLLGVLFTVIRFADVKETA